MGLLERIWRVIRANFNSLVSSAEDPEKILEQAVAEMQQDLITMRQAVAQAIATQKRTERQVAQNNTQAENWYSRAQLALDKGDETLAKEALVKRKSYQDAAGALQSQLSQQNTLISKLKKDLRALESKISEAKMKKDMYIARARSAQSSIRMQELVGNTNTSSSLNSFERMEAKVQELEATSEAIASLGTDDLEKKFSALEGNNELEAELTSMKAKQLKGNQPQQHLPASDSGTQENF
ncbi:MAG: PspA/IM30 family protein [Oscillatoria sp. PMC 1068.18]|nr:PspA/IM30 family protein [Oscillatoria sp. PMC 1076.18]MEC4988226.1 PspA/IM30 family protein [Oscillatoria sp. PMC 1068.18]